jgi:hypothetical protein
MGGSPQPPSSGEWRRVGSPPQECQRTELGAMTISPPAAPRLTIGELEASYPLYCKALRLLIQEGKTIAKVRRTVCWQRLATLHHCMPGQYRDPDYLYALLVRQVRANSSNA